MARIPPPKTTSATNVGQATTGIADQPQIAQPKRGAQAETIPVKAEDLPNGAVKPQGGASWVGVQGAPAKATSNRFDLVPGRYPDAVSLPFVLDQMGQSPEAKATVQGLADQLQQNTGIPIPQALINAAIAKPSRIADLFAVSPAQMEAGVDGLNAAYKAGKLPDLPPMPARLDSGVDLAKLDGVAYETPKPELKELAPGLWQGDLPSTLPPAQIKANVLTAEVFDRLGANHQLAADAKFSVKHLNQTHTRIDTLLDALTKDGHTVEVDFVHRIANFANLKTKAPNGQVLDVPAALMVKTGVKDADGQEASVPATHSEVVIKIRSSDSTEGPAMDADIKWYQGISGTGFFPVGTTGTPNWCGYKVADSLEGDKAQDAVKLCGLLSDAINAVAKDLKLAVGGYGATGVCNDTVAIVQHATTGTTTAYPLLMRDALVNKELDARLSDQDLKDDADYGRLRQAVGEVPSDKTKNASQRSRAASALPWAEGQEAFQSSVDARRILAG